MRGRSWVAKATLAFVLVVIIFWHTYSASFPGTTAPPVSTKLATEPIDVVGLALHATCIVREAVRGLNEHVRPRRIYVITIGDCEAFNAFASNVVCLVEDSVLPDLTKKDVADRLEMRMRTMSGSGDANEIFKGRSLSGWYYQQVLKMGASRHIAGLSDVFLLWDMDMIPLRPLTLFEPRRDSDSVPSRLEDGDSPLRTHNAILQVGGVVVKAYELSYERLFGGQKVEYARDHSSLVVHHMLIWRPVMEEILQRIERLDSTSWTLKDGEDEGVVLANSSHHSTMTWANKLIDSANEKDLELGFSEYTTYASYALQKHANVYTLAKRCTWRRYPYFSWISAAFRRYVMGDSNAPCCPTSFWLGLHRALGFEFIGYEVGHNAALCMYDPREPRYGLARK